MMNQKKRLLLNAAILIATTLMIRSIGVGFNAWLASRIGAEGMGLFQLIMSVYVMAMMLAVSGMRLASTRLCSEALARQESPRRVLWACVRVNAAWGLGAMVLLLYAAGPVADLYGRANMVYPLRILALSLPLVAIETSLYGYLASRRRMPVVGALQIVEQLARVGLTVAALRILPPGGDYAILAVVLGMAATDVSSFLLMLIYCLFDLRKMDAGERVPGVFSSIFRIALPDAVGSWIRSLLSTTEQMLVPARLEKSSLQGEALATYGLIQGLAMPVLFLPGAPIQVVAGLLVPELAQMHALGQNATIRRTVRRTIGVSLLYSAVVACVLLVGADFISLQLYKTPDAAQYIRLLAVLPLFNYTDLMVDHMLKSLDQQAFCMKVNTADCVLRIAMVIFLLPIGGAGAYIGMLYASAMFNSSLSIYRLFSVIRGLHSKRPHAKP